MEESGGRWRKVEEDGGKVEESGGKYDKKSEYKKVKEKSIIRICFDKKNSLKQTNYI